MKKKIAVLGSGIGSLTTAHELLKARADVEITVYQMGWRCGGKGASGRNADVSSRIEEHGLHMWSGLYENAFRVIREAYGALGRAAGAPLATWQDAFKPHSSIVMFENVSGEWRPWAVETPTNADLPGEPDAKLPLELWDYAGEALGLIFGNRKVAHEPASAVLRLALTAVGKIMELAALALFLLLKVLGLLGLVERLLLLVLRLFMALFWWGAQSHMADDPVRRAWLIANFAYANLHGALASRVMTEGMDPLDEFDYRDWLGRYAYPDNRLMLESPLAYFLYDAQFSYLDGDLKRPDIGAGASLRTVIRMGMTCKGAVLWRMQAGMGDVVFGPLYETLKRQGVKFEFFHQVKALKLSADQKSVARIEGIRQAGLKHPERGYQPFVVVKGLPCWPSTPHWDQLKDGERWAREKVDFEDYQGPGVGSFTLTAGKEFDEIVFGIPVAAIPHVAPDLVAARQDWRDLVTNLQTVRTQALQLWLSEASGALQVPGPDQPLLVGYHLTPLNTMSDMTFLTEREAWPAAPGQYPLSGYYFCGPMAEGPNRTKEVVRELLHGLAKPLFPAGYETSHQISEYLRSNVTPSERFTLTNTGSTKYRLKPGGSGFTNLKLCGDWTDNTFNLANIEATVMSGMLCSQAICGAPRNDQIVGLGFGGKGAI